MAFLQQYGSHYVSEALYGSELSCTIYFPSKKAQQQLWLQYQKGEHAVARRQRMPILKIVVRGSNEPTEDILNQETGNLFLKIQIKVGYV